MEAVRVSPKKLSAFVQSILGKRGAAEKEAQIFSNALVWNDQIGRPTHGVWRLPAYFKRLGLGLIKSPCKAVFKEKAKALNLLDGGHGFGHYVGHIAMLRAVELAEKEGVGGVGVYNSNHFGTGAYFVNLAAEKGMAGIALSNSMPRTAPFGGIKPVFGTNPFSFGVPRKNERNILFDMATAGSSGSIVMKHAEKGRPLPEGIAIDDQGKPIVDPNLISKGALLPFGGPKGYGLTLMIEILSGVITGAGISHGVKSMFKDFKSYGYTGHLLIAIDIKKLMPLKEYYERLESLLFLVKSSREGVDDTEVLIPGEIRWRIFKEASTKGIPLEGSTVKALEELSEELAIPVPW